MKATIVTETTIDIDLKTAAEWFSGLYAKWQVDRATPENPEVCFDYELMACLLNLLKRLGADVEWRSSCVESVGEPP